MMLQVDLGRLNSLKSQLESCIEDYEQMDIYDEEADDVVYFPMLSLHRELIHAIHQISPNATVALDTKDLLVFDRYQSFKQSLEEEVDD